MTALDMQKAPSRPPRMTIAREDSISCAVSSWGALGIAAPPSGIAPNVGWPGAVSWKGVTYGTIRPTIIAPIRGMAYVR